MDSWFLAPELRRLNGLAAAILLTGCVDHPTTAIFRVQFEPRAASVSLVSPDHESTAADLCVVVPWAAGRELEGELRASSPLFEPFARWTSTMKVFPVCATWPDGSQSRGEVLMYLAKFGKPAVKWGIAPAVAVSLDHSAWRVASDTTGAFWPPYCRLPVQVYKPKPGKSIVCLATSMRGLTETSSGTSLDSGIAYLEPGDWSIRAPRFRIDITSPSDCTWTIGHATDSEVALPEMRFEAPGLPEPNRRVRSGPGEESISGEIRGVPYTVRSWISADQRSIAVRLTAAR